MNRHHNYEFISAKLTCILMMLLFVSGCTVASITPISSPYSTCNVTVTPLQITPPPTLLPDDIFQAKKLYQVDDLPYTPIDRNPLLPLKAITPTNYQLKDGVYANINSTTSTNQAIIMLTGDVMCQGRQQDAAYDNGTYDFSESFDIVRKVFDEADLVVGNLETMICSSAPYMSEEPSVGGLPHCNAPTTYLDALRYAGFDVLVNANNHSCDTGVMGILETNYHCDRYGFMHTGTFSSPDEPRFLLIDVNGIRIAIMSYSTKYNGKDKYYSELGKTTLLNRYSKSCIESDVAEAKKNGAQFIIAYNHWGVEYTNTEAPYQVKWAQEMADVGVDYIIGSHPHALQKYDVLTASDGRSVPVVYSMGNFISHMKRTITKDTIILRLELVIQNGTVTSVQQGYIPCRTFTTFLGNDYVVVPVVGRYANGHTSRYFAPALKRIKGVMGNKIWCLE